MVIKLYFWMFPNYGYADPVPPLRNGHLDIEDTQCAERKISCHIISCLSVMGVQKGRFGRSKCQFSSKVATFFIWNMFHGKQKPDA